MAFPNFSGTTPVIGDLAYVGGAGAVTKPAAPAVGMAQPFAVAPGLYIVTAVTGTTFSISSVDTATSLAPSYTNVPQAAFLSVWHAS